MSPHTERTLEKIRTFIQEIHDCYSGKIQEITISNLSKEELKELRKALGYKCSSADLGFFSFYIKYSGTEKKKKFTRTLMGLPVDYGVKN